MDFLRLHLPGLHQALRGALDSLSSFVSYLMGDEVPTAERKEARAAEELGEVAAGRPGKPEEKGAQEALEGLGGSQSQEDRGLGGPGEAGRTQEGSSATEQTWGWEEGSSHGSQAHRQDTGVWEATKAARCQEPRAHLESRKESEAGCEAARDNSSQAQESQRPNEQEVNREETLRTWEQEEEAEEVRERKPEVARKAESEWTWHREPEGEAGADGQKVAGDSRESLEQPVKEAVAQEIQGSAANEAGKEEEVMGVLRGSPSTRAQEAQESGTESEDGTTSVREEARTALGGEEDSTALGRKEDSTALGRVEDGTASDREEARTVSGKEEAGTSSGREEDRTGSGRGEDKTASDRGEDSTASEREEEDRTASDREEARTATGREEAGITLGRVEARTTSGGEEDRTVSGRGESGTSSGGEEDRTGSGRGEDRTASGGEEEDSTASGREEAGITLGRVEAGTTSGGEEDRTVSGRGEDGTASDRGEDSTASEREEEDRTATGREEAGTTSDKEEDSTASGREEEDSTASGGEEDSTASGREEAGITLGRVEEGTISGGEDRTVSRRGEDGTASDRGEDSTISEREEEDKTATGREEAGTTSGKEEDSRASGREEEDSTASGGEEDSTASGREEAGITFGRVEAMTTSVGKEGDLLGARKTEYEEVSGEKIPEGTGRAWAFQEASRGDQEKEVDENREAEMSFSPKQTQTLGTEGTEEAAKDQTAGREAAEGQGSEGEVGAGFEVQADQGGKEAEGKQASMVRAVPASLEEVMQAEKVKEGEEGCWATEAELPKDNVVNEAEGDTDLEATPEASSPEKEFSGERSEGEAQTGGEAQGVEWGGLEHEVTEVQEPELKAGPQTPTEHPEEGQGGEEELWGASALSKEETEGGLEEYPRTMGDVKPDAPGAEVWENQGRDVERGETQEEKADAQEGEEEAAGGQAPKEAEGGRESALPDVPEAGGEWKTAQDSGCGTEEGETLGAESQELGGRLGADAGTGQSLGESDARETEDEVVEAAVPWWADTTFSQDWRLEEATLSLQDSEDPGASSLAAEIVRDKVALVGRAAGAGGGLEREAGEAWDSEGRQEAGGGVELGETTHGENRGGPVFGLEGSADKEVTGRGDQAEALEAREGEPRGERVEVPEGVVAEGSCGVDGFTSGSQPARAEGTVATVEAEGLPGGQTLLEEEAVGWQMEERGQGSEGQGGDHHPEGEAGRPLDVEDAEVTEDWRAEAKEIVPEGLEDVQGQSTHQEPAEAEPGPRRETAESARGDACDSWSEALLPGSLLDVSVPRSRVLLSRNSSLRRSRPSFRRSRAPEQQEGPPSPPPEEERSTPEQRLLQPEEPPEPSPPKPERTPLPARRRPLGRGFGLAHGGMMQELQARLGQPKPQ